MSFDHPHAADQAWLLLFGVCGVGIPPFEIGTSEEVANRLRHDCFTRKRVVDKLVYPIQIEFLRFRILLGRFLI